MLTFCWEGRNHNILVCRRTRRENKKRTNNCVQFSCIKKLARKKKREWWRPFAEYFMATNDFSSKKTLTLKLVGFLLNFSA